MVALVCYTYQRGVHFVARFDRLGNAKASEREASMMASRF
mgnify:CR=1 FL=1